jgi:hypothetical protein
MFTHKPLRRFITLGQFIIERQSDFPFAKGELSRLLRDIGIAAKLVNREVNKAGLADILGDMGETNVQGEDQKKLDVYANEQFINEWNIRSFKTDFSKCSIKLPDNYLNESYFNKLLKGILCPPKLNPRKPFQKSLCKRL